jgi:ribosome-associated protein
MSDEQVLQIDDGLWIPRAELSYRASRSGGPGGQHVNTSSTRIELLWDVGATPSLSDEQRARVQERLANRINNEGVLLLASSEHRSQAQNRESVTARFAELLAGALRVPKKRKRTRIPRAAKEARLDEKKRRGRTKRMRGPVRRDE